MLSLLSVVVVFVDCFQVAVLPVLAVLLSALDVSGAVCVVLVFMCCVFVWCYGTASSLVLVCVFL